MARQPTSPASGDLLVDDATSTANEAPAEAAAEQITAAVDLSNTSLVSGAVVIDPNNLPTEILAQITQAADNLEAAQRETSALKASLEAEVVKAERLAADLDVERTAHEATRGELARAWASAGVEPPPAEPEFDATAIAEGLFVLRTSKYPDSTGALIARGRLVILGEARAVKLIDANDVRQATMKDLKSAKSPPVRL